MAPLARIENPKSRVETVSFRLEIPNRNPNLKSRIPALLFVSPNWLEIPSRCGDLGAKVCNFFQGFKIVEVEENSKTKDPQLIYEATIYGREGEGRRLRVGSSRLDPKKKKREA
ncbi:hypothetical protein CRG98_000082 [Punica granatum]|uniref:Uncharacterized protein n=1 Tax=Punica granatum TaxID=22663 RepID=A0A2I0LFS6_PUNGR|nr:hypothetical protein CRG98_000082 [Punica granatum]